jgi:large subunit ribosomal protein L10
MAVNKVKKNEILEEIKESIKNAKSISFTSNKWLTVKEISDMRNKLREVNSSLTIAKKTLIKLAFKEVYNVEISDEIMVWQISVLCSNDDAIAWMTVLNSFVTNKEFKDKIVWAGSYFEWEIKNADETSVIASMPSRETLLGRLVWSMMSPVASLARFFDAASKDLEEKGKTKVWELEWKKEEKVETTESKD